MSIATKVYAFAFALASTVSVGIGYTFAKMPTKVDKPKTLATNPEDPKCKTRRPHCITDEGKIHISFFW